MTIDVAVLPLELGKEPREFVYFDSKQLRSWLKKNAGSTHPSSLSLEIYATPRDQQKELTGRVRSAIARRMPAEHARNVPLFSFRRAMHVLCVGIWASFMDGDSDWLTEQTRSLPSVLVGLYAAQFLVSYFSERGSAKKRASGVQERLMDRPGNIHYSYVHISALEDALLHAKKPTEPFPPFIEKSLAYIIDNAEQLSVGKSMRLRYVNAYIAHKAAQRFYGQIIRIPEATRSEETRPLPVGHETTVIPIIDPEEKGDDDPPLVISDSVPLTEDDNPEISDRIRIVKPPYADG